MKAYTKPSIILLIILLTFHDYGMAGLPAGPYIAWVNLHEDTQPQVTKSIRDFLKTQQDQNICHGYLPSWIVYTKKRPTGITNELTNKALNQQDILSKRKLIDALKSFKDQPDVKEGLDGIIAYTEIKSPHIISMDTHGKIKISKSLKNTSDAQELINGFCSTIPEVYRK